MMGIEVVLGAIAGAVIGAFIIVTQLWLQRRYGDSSDRSAFSPAASSRVSRSPDRMED